MSIKYSVNPGNAVVVVVVQGVGNASKAPDEIELENVKLNVEIPWSPLFGRNGG